MADDITFAEAARKHVSDPEHRLERQDGRRGDENTIRANSTSLLASGSLNGRGNAPVHASNMLAAQRTYGNRAVQRFVQRSADTTVTVQRESDEEEAAKSALGDAAVKVDDTTTTDTVSDKEFAAKMSGSSSTVEEPKSPGEGVVEPDKGSSSAEAQARVEREKQDDKEIYERELRRAEQERIRDTSIPLNNVGEENLRGQVRDGAFTPLGGQRRVNPWGL